MKKAVLYRMVNESHVCPFGIRAFHALNKLGFEIEDHQLASREETESFKEKYGVKTTPQIFIGDDRIGGFDDLVKKFNLKTLKQEGVTYTPVVAVFIVALLISLAIQWGLVGKVENLKTFFQFVAISMTLLAMLKLRDLYAFTNQFITYDVLAKKFLPYATIYPFAELASGLSMLAGLWTSIFAVVMITIGCIGGYSVFKAVYVEKRELKCACVGGNSNVPLGFVSFTENLMMVLLGIMTLLR